MTRVYQDLREKLDLEVKLFTVKKAQRVKRAIQEVGVKMDWDWDSRVRKVNKESLDHRDLPACPPREEKVHQGQLVPQVHLEKMVNQEPLEKMDCRVNKDLRDLKEQRVIWASKERRATQGLWVHLVLLASLAHPVPRQDSISSRLKAPDWTTVTSTVRKFGAFRDRRVFQVCRDRQVSRLHPKERTQTSLVPRAHVVLLVTQDKMEGRVNQVQEDHQEQTELLVHQAPKGRRVTKVQLACQDFREQREKLERMVYRDSQVNQVHLDLPELLGKPAVVSALDLRIWKALVNLDYQAYLENPDFLDPRAPQVQKANRVLQVKRALLVFLVDRDKMDKLDYLDMWDPKVRKVKKDQRVNAAKMASVNQDPQALRDRLCRYTSC